MINNLIEGIQISIIGIFLVFLILFILSLILQYFSKLIQDKEIKPRQQTRQLKQQKSVEDIDTALNDKKHAVIISAIMAEVLDENQYVVNINKVNRV
ncbi:MAG: OadG family transporter subunit [Halothermotrichaceae bacterium]